MSNQQTLAQMRELRLNGMAEAFEHQLEDPLFLDIGCEQRVQMMVEAEMSARHNQRYHRLIKAAKLPVLAVPEEIEYRPSRGLDKAKMADLLSGSWLEHGQNLLLTGATGTGKSWLSSAIAVKAARSGYTIGYHRVSNALEAMATAHNTGELEKVRGHFTRPRLLILDDFGISSLSPRNRTDLFELVQRRSEASTIIASQLPVSRWHEFIGDPTIADSIMDRWYNTSQKIALKGESMRRLRKPA